MSPREGARTQGNRTSSERSRRLPTLRTSRLLLRLAKIGDEAKIISYFQRNEEHFAMAQPRRSGKFYTANFWRSKIRSNMEDFTQDRSCILFVFEIGGKRGLVGHVQFSGFQRGSAQSCYLGYGIDQNKEGKGYMLEAIERAIQFAFKELNFHRISANYIPTNSRSGRLLERLGFVVEGYARKYLMVDKCWQDHILTSKTNENWRAK